MSVFTRNDKMPETNPGATPTPPQPPVQPVRPQATAQPLSPAPHPASHGPVSVSVISKALKITGQLESTEDIQIEGEVDGDVHAASVKVGANAKVKGTVYGDIVELAGSIDGRIEARKVVLTSTAHMAGDVIHQDLTIQSGAFIDGHCKPEFGKSAGAKSATASKPSASTSSSSTTSYSGSSLAADKTNGSAARP
jgi:cytoskeletal protein CcmA (bactofilin family)